MEPRSIADLPGPRRLPGLGNAHRLRADRIHLTVERWSRLHGPVFRFAIGPRPVVAIADPAAINAILRDRPGGYRRWREMQTLFSEMSVDGVFSAEGEDWRRQRRLAVTALNTDHLHRFYGVIDAATARLHARLAAAADHGRPVEIDREFSAFTVDVTTALAFGLEPGAVDAGLEAHLAAVFRMAAVRLSAPVPYWRYVKLPADRRFDRSLAVLKVAVDGFIAVARRRMEERPELADAPENFLDAMLAAQRREGRVSEAELFGNVLTMLLAGEDTTSHTLSWTAWFLATEPAVQERLAAEAAGVLGEDSRPADHTTVGRLPYAEAVLRESLRLRSVAPIFMVETLEDRVEAGVRLPAGTSLMLLTRHAALQDTSFARPAVFDPDRWLGAGPAGPDGAHDAKAWLPFGAGPRFCPGRNLALLEAKAALAMIARSFEVTLDPTAPPVRERFGFTMAPAGLRVRLAHRAGDRAAAPAPVA